MKIHLLLTCLLAALVEVSIPWAVNVGANDCSPAGCGIPSSMGVDCKNDFNMVAKFSSASFEDVLKFVLDRAHADYKVINATTLRIVKKQSQPTP
jgi:hypothetical protein